MIKKYLAPIVLGCTLLLPSAVFAHSTGPWGSEADQWIVDPYNHAGTSNITYRLVNASAYDSTVTSAAKKWNNTGPVTITKTSTNYKGTVSQYADPDTSTIAKFDNYTSSNRHLTSWYIFINQPLIDGSGYSTDKKATILAHEFGHAIGLNDLYDASYNIGVLMYGYDNGTATNPTQADVTGAKEAIK